MGESRTAELFRVEIFKIFQGWPIGSDFNVSAAVENLHKIFKNMLRNQSWLEGDKYVVVA